MKMEFKIKNLQQIIKQISYYLYKLNSISICKNIDYCALFIFDSFYKK